MEYIDMKMDELLLASFGEETTKINVKFSKTIQVKQYEPETVTVESELEFNGSLLGITRDTITNVLQSTLEYSVLCHNYKKGLITKEEFAKSKENLEESAEAILNKYEKLTGSSRYSLLNLQHQ